MLMVRSKGDSVMVWRIVGIVRGVVSWINRSSAYTCIDREGAMLSK